MNPFRMSKDVRDALRPRALAPEPVGEGTVELRLFDPIDSWGGEWGVSAKEFAVTLDRLPADTKEIRLLINSPGGEVYEGLAILNALRAHPARIVAVVQGIAASSASFIAAGADELVMMKNSELFIHKAWGVTVGNADDMRSMADDLDHLDDNLASIYLAKAGGTVEHWRTLMADGVFFSAEEAVDAGLADRVEGVGDAAEARARFDLSVFMNSSTRLPGSTEPGEPIRKEVVVDYDELTAGIRERLGVTDADADGETLLAALDEALAEQVDETPAAPVVPEGAQVVDAGVFAQLQADAAAGRQALEAQAAARRDAVVANALREGRIAPASSATWLAQMERDEDGTTALLASLVPNTVPVAEVGHQVERDDNERLYAAAWGDDEVKGA